MKVAPSVLSVLRPIVNEICALLRFYAVQIVSYLPTFRDNVPDPFCLALVGGEHSSSRIFGTTLPIFGTTLPIFGTTLPIFGTTLPIFGTTLPIYPPQIPEDRIFVIVVM